MPEPTQDQQFAAAFPELAQIKAKAMASPNLAERLTLMKEYIEKSKLLTAQAQGQLQGLEQQRGSELGVQTDAEAEAYIKELEGDIARLKSDEQAGIEAVQDGLGW